MFGIDALLKIEKAPFPSFRLNETCPRENREPESKFFEHL